MCVYAYIHVYPVCMWVFVHHISAIKCHGFYLFKSTWWRRHSAAVTMMSSCALDLFHDVIYCDYHSRVAANQAWCLFIKLVKSLVKWKIWENPVKCRDDAYSCDRVFISCCFATKWGISNLFPHFLQRLHKPLTLCASKFLGSLRIHDQQSVLCSSQSQRNCWAVFLARLLTYYSIIATVTKWGRLLFRSPLLEVWLLFEGGY